MRRSGQGLPSAALKPCGTAPPAMPASFCRWSWWNGKTQGGCHPPCGGGILPHRGVLLSAHGGQHRPVRMAALQGTRRFPLLGKFWRGSGEHRAELPAHLRKAGCPRYGRYRCCHRHAGFPTFEPAFDLDRLCGLPSKGSGTPAHRGDLDTVGGRFMFIFRVQRRA